MSWMREDIEQRLLFPGGRATSVNTLLSAIFGLLLTVVFYMALLSIDGTWFSAIFTERGYVPYFIVFLRRYPLGYAARTKHLLR